MYLADRRTDGAAADPGSPGPTCMPNTSTYLYRGKARKRGSSSAESCVRDQLLFSRTTQESLFGEYVAVLGCYHAALSSRCMFIALCTRWHGSAGSLRYNPSLASHTRLARQCRFEDAQNCKRYLVPCMGARVSDEHVRLPRFV